MDLSRFNTAQRTAIVHFKGPALVLAGPGSGKTTVLTRRIVYLVKEKKVPPEKIIVVTFTKAAAEEMKNRFLALVDDGQAVRFGTFHAIFFSILKTYYKDLKIINTESVRKKLQVVLKYCGLDPLLYEAYEKELSYIKNRGYVTEEYKPQSDEIEKTNVFRVLKILREMSIKDREINFDDMAYETYLLFKEKPELLEKWKNKFSFFLLDEFQDICPVQYLIINMLCEKERNIFVVGDDDQSIYGFRGAGTDIMLGFPKDYPDAICINLNRNYRCMPEIINCACKVIIQNKKRFSKVQEPARENENADAVKINSFVTEKLQLEWLVEKILRWKDNGEINDAAILFRKHGDYDKLITRLKSYGIPFRLNDTRKSIKDTFIFCDIWQYLMFLDGCDKRSIFFNIMNKPYRGMLRQGCALEYVNEQQLCDFYIYDNKLVENIHRLFEARHFSKSLSLFGKINYIRHGLGYENYLVNEAAHNAREENQYISIIDEIQKTSFSFENKEQWFRYINSIEMEDQKKVKQSGINILTYHASKGLEFKHVILPGVNEGNVPYNKAVTEDEIEEERRMFYVAMTRAKDELYITYISGTSEQPEKASRFLKVLEV